MSLIRRTLLLVALSVVPVVAQLPIEPPVPVVVTIEGVDLKGASSDRVRFEVRSSVTAIRKLKVRQIRFEQMRLGNVPIYLSPIEQHLELEKAKPVPLPRIPLTIYFRDMDSLDPLRNAIQDGQVTVTGVTRVDLDLTLLERLAIRQWNPHAELPIQITIPLSVPGGAAGRTAALATLHAGQLALNLTESAFNSLRQSQFGWNQELTGHYSRGLIVAESRYSLLLGNDRRLDVSIRGLGFRISEDRFVLTGELTEPWKYDTQVAAAIQTGEASLVEGASDLLVWPVGEVLDRSAARSLSSGRIRLESGSGETDVAQVAIGGRTKRIRLLKRDSAANYAVLRFVRPEDRGSPPQFATTEATQRERWDRLTLFRVNQNGTLESISTSARRQDRRIRLDDPVDDGAFGSLLIAPDGAIGMVQEEHGGMLLRSEW